MSEEIRQERIGALVEVVHSVLLSLEDFSPGQSAMRENWGRVVSGVQQRLSGAVDWSGGHGFGREQEAVEPIDFSEPPAGAGAVPPSERPPSIPAGSGSSGESSGSVGLGSIDLFLEQSANQPNPFAEPPAEPAPWAPEQPSDQDSFPSQPDDDIVRLPVEAEPPPSDADPAALRREVEQLRSENADLRRQLEARPAVAVAPSYGDAPGLRPEEILAALGVTDVPPAGAEAGLVEHVQRVGAYLEGTHRNLNHVFGKLKLSVHLPTFADTLSSSLGTGQDVHSYLECLRDCWKILVGGTWNSLRGWCDRLESSLNPQEIDRISRQQRMKPWDLYVDLYKRMALYNNLIEFLRTKIKAQIRERQPQLLHE